MQIANYFPRNHFIHLKLKIHIFPIARVWRKVCVTHKPTEYWPVIGWLIINTSLKRVGWNIIKSCPVLGVSPYLSDNLAAFEARSLVE